jgi:hypothetical protein
MYRKNYNNTCFVAGFIDRVEEGYELGMPLHMINPSRSMFLLLNQNNVNGLGSESPAQLHSTIRDRWLIATDAAELTSNLRCPDSRLNPLSTTCSCGSKDDDCPCALFELLVAIDGFGNTIEIHGKHHTITAALADVLLTC